MSPHPAITLSNPIAIIACHSQFGKDLWIEEAITHFQPGGLQQQLRCPQMLVEKRDAVRNLTIEGGVKALSRIHEFHNSNHRIVSRILNHCEIVSLVNN